MKYCRALFLLVVLLAACATPKGKVLFIPNPEQDKPPEQTGVIESWEILESQNGPGETGLPAWVRQYQSDGLWGIESLIEYSGRYVFVGENRGENFNVLRQWADNFAAAQDLPRLIAKRTEQRLVAGAGLYPDDEYGEYFEKLIKKVSDSEYPGAVKEQTFWIKQKVKVVMEEIIVDDDGEELPQEDIFFDRYEFLVLISIDAETLQNQIGEIMAHIRTRTSATREQTAAINRMKLTFFEGF